jgi:DNA-binding GntR family transcriptional regulator
MTDASDRADSTAYSAANFDFHFGIYRAARSFHLMPLIESLWLRIGPMLDIGAEGRTRAETRMFEGQEAHRDILAAITRKDPDTARARLADDLARARDWFLRHHRFPPATDGVRPVPARPEQGPKPEWSMTE